MRLLRLFLAAICASLALLLSDCVVTPPRLPVRAPTATSAPTPTPLPSSLVTLAVHLPLNLPPGTVPAAKILDEVGGTSQILPLTNGGDNLWTASLTAVQGEVLRYKYIRTLPVYVEEAAPNRQPVTYRLLSITSANVTAEDTVGAWSDTPYAGDTGDVSGTLINRQTGQGLMGLLISAGGQLVLTGWDGGFEFYGLPPGAQRLTAIAPDGAFGPAQTTVIVTPNQTVTANLDAKPLDVVHVTFMVRPPASATDASAPVRLAGNLWQLGDTFMPAINGSAISAGREVTLSPLGDGRWTATVTAYAGSVLHYKYTLGDGFWNGELDLYGRGRLRQLLVPAHDLMLEETVDTWHYSSPASVTFEATVPGNTPPNDTLVIQFKAETWLPPLPMWRTGANTWKFVLYNPEEGSGKWFYRYCRNYACNTADDAETAGARAQGRYVTLTMMPQDLPDEVQAWQWLPAAPAPAAPVLVMPITPTAGYAAGIDLVDDWPTSAWTPALYSETLRTVQATGANWLTFTRHGVALQMQPTPAYADDLSLAAWPAEWNTEVAQAHAANLKVALHPVTCHYSPYGACEYWSGVAFTPEFWNRWFAAYEDYIVTEAELAARAGADLLVVGDFKLRPAFPGEPEAPPNAEARWRHIVASVRAHYKGQLAFELLMGQTPWPAPPPFLDAVDVVRFFWWSTLSASQTPTIPDLTAVAGNLMDKQLAPVQQRFKKPVQISAAYYAVEGAATQCVSRADGQCYRFEAFNPDSPEQPATPPSLQEQANLYEALLTAASRRPWIAGFAAYGYNPTVTLLDKSISVRGKPAGAVLAAWYPKLTRR